MRTLIRLFGFELEPQQQQEETLISPLSYTDRKGGAFPIMLQQFRRAIGVAIGRGNAELRRGRLHYVRPTKEEAYHAAGSRHSNNKWTGSGKADGSKAIK